MESQELEGYKNFLALLDDGTNKLNESQCAVQNFLVKGVKSKVEKLSQLLMVMPLQGEYSE